MPERDVIDFKNAVAEPFPGLRSFEPHESFLFFGRRKHTEELLNRLGHHRFLAVVGTSGSGKSSLVRAGLLPALYRGHLAGAGSRWRIAIMRPGDAPLDRLTDALADDDVLRIPDLVSLRKKLGRSSLGLSNVAAESLTGRDSLLLVVDQFEELFRFQQRASDEGEEASLFVHALLEASDQVGVPVYVVLTMRSDFLGDCAKFAGLPEALNESQYLIPRLTRKQRQEAIEGPLRLAQHAIAPRLVQRLLNDAGDEPDQLPVLQHALLQTFRHAHDAPLDLEQYEKAGTLRGALDKHAETIYDALPTDAHRSTAESVFRGLTVLQHGRAVRRPATLAHLYDVTGDDQQLVNDVVSAFCHRDCSLLVSSRGEELTPDTIIDISHESLIRKWSRLRRWVADEARSAEYYRDASRDAALHDEGEAGYWHGPKLREAMRYLKSRQWNASWASQYERGGASSFGQSVGFLRASRRREKVSRGSVVLMWVLFAAALGIAGLFYHGQEDAQREAQLQKERADVSEAQAALMLTRANDAQARADEAAKTAEELRRIVVSLEATGTQTSEEIQQLNDQIYRLEGESARYSTVADTARRNADDVKQQKLAPADVVEAVEAEADSTSAVGASFASGIAAWQNEDWEGTIRLMQDSLLAAPDDPSRSIRMGKESVPYVPSVFISIAYCQLNRCEEARASVQRELVRSTPDRLMRVLADACNATCGGTQTR